MGDIIMSLNWGIIGTGTIANEMAASLLAHQQPAMAVTARDQAKLTAFAEQYQIPKTYETVADLLADETIDAVYIATPHNTHFDFIKQALAHHKHVLAEKAITVSNEEYTIVRKLAQDAGLVLLEAMTPVHMPLFKRLRELINQGSLGQIKVINTTFGSHKAYDPKNRFFNPDLAGGALLDIGGYATQASVYFMNSTPSRANSMMVPFETGVDEQSVTILANDNHEMATITLSMQAKQPKAITISGTKGYLRIPDFPRADAAIWYHTDTGESEAIALGNSADALWYEISDFEQAVQDPKIALEFTNLTGMQFETLSKIQQEW